MKFKDPIINKLVKKYPAPKFEDRSKFLYEDLIETIISQQLSGKAANTIFTRFKKLFGQKSFPNPQDILEMKDEEIRTAGISFQKTSYLKSTADAFVNNLINAQRVKEMTDEEAISSLTQIKGIGRWSAEMILIFTFNRPDIFSIGDLGLRNAVKNLYGITDQKQILKLSEKWSPYRSTASWYLWRSLENR